MRDQKWVYKVMNPASELVDFVLELRPSILPIECLETAKRCLMDFFAVALAGSREPIAEVLKLYLAEYAGTSSVVGLGG